MTKLKPYAMLESRFPTLFETKWIDEVFKGLEQGTPHFFKSSQGFPKYDVVELQKEGKTVATQLRFAFGGTGYNKDNVVILVEDDKLIVKSSDKFDNKKTEDFDEVIVYNGIAKRSFIQEYSLNTKLVDADNVTAEFKDGTLQITIPHKQETQKVAYQVQIN